MLLLFLFTAAATSQPAAPLCRSLHIAINSVEWYERPRMRLLASLRNASVPMDQVHVFLGGAKNSSAWCGADGTNYYAVPHNSVDFTAMIHIVEQPAFFGDVRTWFYVHDTTEVGPTFWAKMSKYCAGLETCALPLIRSKPSFNVGLYDARFLANQTARVVTKKNLNHKSLVRPNVSGGSSQSQFSWPVCIRVCVCVCARARVCVCVCVCVC